jgi:hypothetical protein
MAQRSGFDSVFVNTDGTPLVNIKATILNSANEQVTVYEAKTGGAPKAQPIVTTSAVPGLVKFWADPGFYQVRIEDNESSARFSPRNIPFDAVAGDTVSGAEGISFSQIPDITTAKLTSEAVTKPKLKLRTFTAGGVGSCSISSIPAGVYFGTFSSNSTSKDGPVVTSGTATIDNPTGPGAAGAFILTVTSTAAISYTIQSGNKCGLTVYGIAN